MNISDDFKTVVAFFHKKFPTKVENLLERQTRFELAASSLARKRSTAELLPLILKLII